MNLLLMAACCLALVELFQRLRIRPLLNHMWSTAAAAAATIRSTDLSDRQKEMVLRQSTLTLFFHSVKLFVAILLTFSPFFIAVAVTQLVGRSFLDFLVSAPGLLYGTAITAAYAVARHRFIRTR